MVEIKEMQSEKRQFGGGGGERGGGETVLLVMDTRRAEGENINQWLANGQPLVKSCVCRNKAGQRILEYWLLDMHVINPCFFPASRHFVLTTLGPIHQVVVVNVFRVE